MTVFNTNYAFGRFLRFWRSVHGLSQEELAFRLDSSPRHISRLENGSGRPSEAMVLQIAKELSLGERDCNHLLVAAGFAPQESGIGFHSPELRWLRTAIRLQMRALEPYPTALLHGSTDILMVNRAWVGFHAESMPLKTLMDATNHTDILYASGDAKNLVGQSEDTLSAILMSLTQRALFTDSREDWERCQKLESHPVIPDDWRQRAARIEPLASWRVSLKMKGDVHGFYSVNSTIGARGPAEYLSEPRLTMNTLYPEDSTLELDDLLDHDIDHPLLYTRR